MPSIRSTLNANLAGDVTSHVSMTTEQTITLYVCSDTGTYDTHRIGIEVSPEAVGDSWCEFGAPINGLGVQTYIVCAERARAKVYDAEGAESTAIVFIDAH